MFIFSDVESLAKTRRSLLVTSTAHLFFKFEDYVKHELSYSGFKFKYLEIRLVVLGQSITLYLFFVFLLQAIPEFFKMFGWMWDARINSQERKAWQNFRDDWGFHNGDYDNSDGPDAEINQIKEKFEWLRKRKTSSIELLTSISYFTTNFFVAYFSPVALALICLIWPDALGLLIK